MVESMKKLLWSTMTILGVMVLCLYAVVLIFIVTGAFAIFMPDPPKPKITYGEFPFTITYEVNKETMTYTDVIICEYEGIENLGTAGKRRKWKERLKSGNEQVVLLKSSINGNFFEIRTYIPGFPEYFMGDFQRTREEYESMLWFSAEHLMYEQEDGSGYALTKDEAWKQYGVRIINIECSPPIENEFE